MSNLVILNLQTVVALGVYVVIYRTYLRRWFAAQPFGQAVLPLLLLNVFRYAGLAVLVPGQLDSRIPVDALQVIAWGDFAAGVCALLAAIAVHHRWSIAPLLVALFLVVGVGDVISVGYTAKTAGVFETSMGTQWFVSVLYAPAFLLSHVYIAYRLAAHFRFIRPLSLAAH